MLFFRTEDSSRKEKKEISFLSGKHRRHRNRKTALGRRFRRLEFFLAGILDWDTWPECSTGILDWNAWLGCLTGMPGRNVRPESLTGVLDRNPWPERLTAILDWDGPSGHLSSAHESYLRKTLEKNGSLLEL